MVNKNKPLIIYGPKGCGKGEHTEELAKFFNKTKIIAGFDEGGPIDKDCIIFCEEAPSVSRKTHVIISFSSAMNMLDPDNIEIHHLPRADSGSTE